MANRTRTAHPRSAPPALPDLRPAHLLQVATVNDAAAVLPTVLLEQPWGTAHSDEEARRLDLLFLMADNYRLNEHTMRHWWRAYIPGAKSRPLGFGVLGLRPTASWVLTTLASIALSLMLRPISRLVGRAL